MSFFQNLFILVFAGLVLMTPTTVLAQKDKLKPLTQSEQKELDRALLAACENAILPKDLPGIVKLLEKGAKIEATDSKGQTPLIVAARDFNGKLIDFLLAAGANPLAQDDEGHSVDRLVGIEIDRETLSSVEELVIVRLIQSTAQEIRDAAALRKAKTMEFMDAVVANDTEKALRLLYASRSKTLDLDFDLNHKEGKREPSDAVYADYIDERNLSSTALMIASFNGNIELVKALLKENGRIDRYNSGHKTALHTAVRARKVEVAKLLLDAGASVDFVDESGATPLITSAILGDVETAKVLLEHKANVNKAGGESNLTPLHLAIRTKNFNLVPIFLKAGANPNALAKNNVTPLMWAAEEGDENSVISLLQGGANPNLKNVDGSTALDYAQKKNQIAVVTTLTEGKFTKPEFKTQ